MRNLIITLLATSSVDSLNPIGITQQFILQGMVKKPRHIWYFILTTGVVNMIFGYMVYYGIINGLSHLLGQYRLVIYWIELAVGLGLLVYGAKDLIVKLVALRKNPDAATDQTSEEEKVKAKIRSVAPLALIGIGVISTASELTSAVPYFAFLAVLVTYELPFWLLTLIFVFYNIIYMLPFMLLYVLCIISKEKFDKFYIFFKERFKKYSKLLVSLVLVAIGLAVIIDAISGITSLIG